MDITIYMHSNVSKCLDNSKFLQKLNVRAMREPKKNIGGASFNTAHKSTLANVGPRI